MSAANLRPAQTGATVLRATDMLVETPDNPAPAGAMVTILTAADGVRLRVARWPAAGRSARGTVCLFQGRAETIEKYFETIADIRARGFAVATLDWRGQGGSDRLLNDSRRGHVEDFADHHRDLALFMTMVRQSMPRPHIGLSHSMGGLILAGGIASAAVGLDRVMMVAPLFGLSPAVAPPAAAVATLARLALLAGFRDRPIPGQERYAPDLLAFADNPLTSDPTRFARSQALFRAAPALVVSGATFGWMYAAMRALSAAARPEFAGRIGLPLMVVGAGGDRVVSTAGAARFAASVAGARMAVVPGTQHEILMGTDGQRSQALAAFDAFVA